MTFYNIIFGILLLAAVGEVLRSLNHPDWLHLWEATTLILLIVSDVIFTSHIVEERKKPYKVSMKFLDLASFIILSTAIFALNPTEKGFFQVEAASRYEQLDTTAVFWWLVVLYWGVICGWNVYAGVYRSVPRGTQWWWQPLLIGPLIVMAMAAVIAPGSGFVHGFSVAMTAMVAAYLGLYKKHVLNALSDERPRAKTPAVVLAPLSVQEQQEIHAWPPYPPQFMALDYALRAKTGWLAMFPESPQNHRFSARVASELVGFSILTERAAQEAEFYVAVHPSKLGAGIGTEITRQTKACGFDQLHFRRIWLKVRTWHADGIRVYERMGFRKVGTEFKEQAGGSEDKFIVMETYSQ